MGSAPYLLFLFIVICYSRLIEQEQEQEKELEQEQEQEEDQEHYYLEHDYQAPWFDPSLLETVETFLRPLASCPTEQERVTVLRYPWQGEDGELHQDNLTLAYGEDYVETNKVTFKTEISSGVYTSYMSTIRPHLNCLDQGDPDLVAVVRNKYLTPPSLEPYNLTTSTFHYSGSGMDFDWVQAWGDGQAHMLDQRYFHEDKKGGFFIEAGASDGMFASNSLHFELVHKWTGLLVEPVADFFTLMEGAHRKAWLAETCLSLSTSPQTVAFSLDTGPNSVTMGAVGNTSHTGGIVVEMQCLPLYTLLLALGNPTVDFLSLDIEGAELQVLETIPWEQVDIRAISVETQHHSLVDRHKLFVLLEVAGFTHMGSLARDDIFVQLERGGISPRQEIDQVLRRVSPPRLCQYFRVSPTDLEDHCTLHWPRDWYRKVVSLPSCLHARFWCPWTLHAVVATLENSTTHWKLTLADGCKVDIRDSYVTVNDKTLI